ncbi:class I SAM-dependent methyltransferase [Myxococcota bacterium]|nr:class I SAM-dependent methyltransferase [Myxococcota bacterium]
MKIQALLRRPPMSPLAPGRGLPWSEPEFSRRVLDTHLSQQHDRASRRFEIIDQQVAWLHDTLLEARPSQVLDLGCGPGFYTQRLAERGHQCTGLDFSPAAIQYARLQTNAGHGACQYREVDVRTAELGSGFDLILMLYGEFNTLTPDEAIELLARIRAALAPSGRLVVELQFAEDIQACGESSSDWSVESSGPFADGAYLLLHESQWHTEHRVTTERFWVLPERSDAQVYTLVTQAYSDAALEDIFSQAGLSITGRYESMTPKAESDVDLFVVTSASVSSLAKTS